MAPQSSFNETIHTQAQAGFQNTATLACHYQLWLKDWFALNV